MKDISLDCENKLVISDFYNNKILGFYFHNNKLQRISEYNEKSVLGNIYCGYVKDVVKNINAAFVEFDDNIRGYYSLTDNNHIILSPDNNLKIKQGDKILVQVSSDKIKTKDYTLSSKITFTGKYIVLTVGNNNISVSKKINNLETRAKITNILGKYLNDEFGFIARTNCGCADENDIILETEKLIEQWKEIKEKAKYLSAKSLVFSQNGEIEKECNEFSSKTSGLIVTDNQTIYDKLFKKDYNVILYKGSLPLPKCYSLEKHLSDSVKKKVWLKSGGYLVIEPTEALTVIDVNTGKSEIKTKVKEDTFYKLNLEAASEISRQLKVRNISGIIIVDFISMKNKENEIRLLEHMNNLLKFDYSRSIAISMTTLGLMEITRKKIKKSIYEIVDNYE